MTGLFSLAKNPMEITATPCASGGTIIRSMMTGLRSMPIMRGIENP
jgi:hypothetical protein